MRTYRQNFTRCSYELHRLNQSQNLNTIEAILQNVEQILLNDERKHLNLAIPMIDCGVGGLDIKDVFEIYKKYFQSKQNFDKSCDIMVFAYTKDNYNLINFLNKE